MLPPLSLAGHAPPPVLFPVGLQSLPCPATHFLCVGLDSDLRLRFRLPLRPGFSPWVLSPLVCAVEAMTLSGWLLDPFPDSSEWGLLWAEGGLSTVLGFWCFLSRWA